MRRGIGVAHIKKKQEQREQMSELGAQLKAEKVSEVADHLEILEKRLRELAEKHHKQIKSDPVVRARFKQLAGSLNIDILSSRGNLFSKALGLGDYYYDLSVKIIEICMKERRFTGPLVPIATVVSQLNKKKATTSNSGGAGGGGGSSSSVVSTISSTIINTTTRSDTVSEDDVRYALEKVKVLGNGYQIIKLDGVSYIQAAGELSTDAMMVIEFAKGTRKEEAIAANTASPAKAAPVAVTGASAAHQPPASRVGAARIGVSVLKPAKEVASASQSQKLAAEAEQQQQLLAEIGGDIAMVVTCQQVMSGLQWTKARANQALTQLLQDGTAWIDAPAGAAAAPTYWIMLQL